MVTTKLRTARMATGLVLAVLTLGSGTAGAVSGSVKNSCANDYFKFCPSHAVGSSSLRQCMRQVGKRLSNGCIDALVKSGEIKRPR